MSEWKTTTFQSVIDISKGDYITKKEAKPGSYPVILGGREPAYYIDTFNHTGKAIVISRSGASAGFVSRWDEPIFVTDGFIIEPKEGIDYDFVYYALKNNEGILQGKQSGAAIPHVTPRLIYGLQVLLPDLERQHRISTILSAYDSLIETNQRQIKLLEEAAQRLYREWFVDLRFPGHEDVPVVDGVPEGWKKTNVNDIVTFHRGYDLTKDNMVFGPYPVVGSTSVIGYHNVYKISGPGVITGRSGSLGQYQLIWDDFWPHNTTLYVSDFKGHPVLYVYEMVRNLDFAVLNGGGAIPTLNRNLLSNIPTIEPPIALQLRFENAVEPQMIRSRYLTSQIELLSEARDRLLPKLMSGEIAV